MYMTRRVPGVKEMNDGRKEKECLIQCFIHSVSKQCNSTKCNDNKNAIRQSFNAFLTAFLTLCATFNFVRCAR